MTFSRAGSGTQKPPRKRRNRRKTAPLRQRISGLGTSLARVRTIRLSGLRRQLGRLLPGLVALVGVAGVVVGGRAGHEFLLTTSRFAVQAIDIRGNAALASESIQEIINAQPGDNLFALDLGAMTRALEAEPMIARARVRRELPHTLVVEVEENQAAALIELDGLYLAAADGRVFKRAAIERGDGRGLPVITGLTRAEYLEDAEAVHAAIRDALAAAEVYESGAAALHRPALGEINIDPLRGITFTTLEHATAVRVGRGDIDALRERLQVFDVAWQALSTDEQERARIVYADASTRPDRVTIGFEHIE